MKYTDLTLEEALDISLLFDLICDGNKKEIQIEPTEQFDKVIEEIESVITSAIDVLAKVFIGLGNTLKAASETLKIKGDKND